MDRADERRRVDSWSGRGLGDRHVNSQWLLAVAGIGLLVAGLYLFATNRGLGGPAKLKLPFIEAELPVASLVPMVLALPCCSLRARRRQLPSTSPAPLRPQKPEPNFRSEEVRAPLLASTVRR